GFANAIDERPAAPDIERGGLSVDWPLDTIQIGYVLAEILGAPSTNGAGPYIHTFSSGAAQLPSRTFERKLATGQFDGAVGVVGRSRRLPIGSGRGYARVTAEYLVRESVAQYGASIAGSPTALALSNRVPSAVGAIALDGAAMGAVLSGAMTIT